MIITLKVSPLSYGILMLEYPSHERSGTIVATSHSLLMKTMMSRRPEMAMDADHLTRELHVSTKKNPDHTTADIIGIGIVLHMEHQTALMRWIQASVKAGTTASYGIRTFMDHYDLDDDDVNQETILRTWQRYVRRQIDLTARPKDQILSPPRSRADVWDEHRFARFVADIVEYIYGSHGRWNDIRLQHLRLLAYNHGRIANPARIDPLGMKYNTACVAIANIKKWISGHHRVSECWQKYYGNAL